MVVPGATDPSINQVEVDGGRFLELVSRSCGNQTSPLPFLR